jgi:hypothetical protein
LLLLLLLLLMFCRASLLHCIAFESTFLVCDAGLAAFSLCRRRRRSVSPRLLTAVLSQILLLPAAVGKVSAFRVRREN